MKISKNKPCPDCGSNRWKTKVKNDPVRATSTYECRKCGHIRVQTNEEKLNA